MVGDADRTASPSPTCCSQSMARLSSVSCGDPACPSLGDTYLCQSTSHPLPPWRGMLISLGLTALPLGADAPTYR